MFETGIVYNNDNEEDNNNNNDNNNDNWENVEDEGVVEGINNGK